MTSVDEPHDDGANLHPHGTDRWSLHGFDPSPHPPPVPPAHMTLRERLHRLRFRSRPEDNHVHARYWTDGGAA